MVDRIDKELWKKNKECWLNGLHFDSSNTGGKSVE